MSFEQELPSVGQEHKQPRGWYQTVPQKKDYEATKDI